jgi:hypothetical protein
VIEKFNLFLLMIANTDAVSGRRAMLERLSGPVGRYEGLALTLIGLTLIVTAAVRFIHVRRLLADQETHDVGGYGAELVHRRCWRWRWSPIVSTCWSFDEGTLVAAHESGCGPKLTSSIAAYMSASGGRPDMAHGNPPYI